MDFEIAPKETEIKSNWDDAKLYCFTLNIDGKVGWRLPTIDELREIYNSENDFEKYWYWSSTDGYNNGAFVQGFYAGGKGNGNKKHDISYVRAVRDIQEPT